MGYQFDWKITSKYNPLRKAQRQAIIVITELDLPQIQIEVPSKMINGRVNLNEDLVIKMIYNDTNAQNLFYSAVIIYNTDIVSVIKVNYLNFSFRIFQHFEKFDQGNQFTLRASVYNPAFYMPSLASIKVTVNLPPKECILDVTPASGESMLTIFNIKVNNCLDEDLPISYSF